MPDPIPPKAPERCHKCRYDPEPCPGCCGRHDAKVIVAESEPAFRKALKDFIR